MTFRIDTADFLVPPGTSVDLEKWPTHVKHAYASKPEYRERLDAQVAELTSLQRLHYAANGDAVLVIFQGMDAAGKDGAIRQVMSGVNPQGCQVYSFKTPSEEELEHDFLWRTTVRLPERGRIGIFNRSYYEEVVVVRVHPELLARRGLPDEAVIDESFWSDRHRSIVEFEDHLHRNGTRIIKVFLHQSKEEQRRRLLARIDDPHKRWKLGVADVEERKLWDRYMRAYEACFQATSTEHAPWYVVPADDKKNTRLIISHILLDVFQRLDLAYPEPDKQRRRELRRIRRELERESPA